MLVSVLMFTLPRPVSRQPSLMSPSQFNSVDNLHRSDIIQNRQQVSFYRIDFYSLTFDRIQCWRCSRQIRSKVEFPVSAASSATNPLPDISGANKRRFSHRQISNLEEY